MTRADDLFRSNLKMRQGLYARVKQTVTVRDGKRIEVVLKITALNRTNKTIVLDEPYRVPVGQASNVAAYDVINRKPLLARHHPGSKRLEVHFEANRELRPNEQMTWRVSFTSTRFRILKSTKDPDCSIGVFVLDPLEKYKNVPIINHRVQLRVRFIEVRDGNLFKRPFVDQSNNQQVGVRPIERPRALDLVFDKFDLPRGQSMKATFNYRFAKISKARTIWAHYARPVLSHAAKVGLAILPILLKELIDRRFRHG